jgi:large subunit ribosomal protein L4
MADAPVLGDTDTVALDATAFGAAMNIPLVHESVRAELNARRRGTHSTKTRGQVSGGGAKPWRQKGTGRARAGSSRSPIWVGGGTVFGPQPRNYTFKVNRKERRAALRSALSLHAERESLAVLDPAPYLDTPSSKSAALLLKGWNQPKGGILVVLTDDESKASLSFRNLERVSVLPATAVGIADLIGATAVLASRGALDQLTERATK